MRYIKTLKIVNNLIGVFVILLSALAIFFIYNNFFKAVQDLKDISLIKYDIFINTFSNPQKWESAIKNIEEKKNNSLKYKSSELKDPFTAAD